MKILTHTIILFLFFVAVSQAKEQQLIQPEEEKQLNEEELIQKANELYAEDNYEEAIETYNQILNSRTESPVIYYNLANAYYKQNQLSYAILNYERALLLAPNDKDIKYNLELANTKIVDKIEQLPQFFLIKWGRNFVAIAHTNTWASISIAAFILMFLLLLLFFFSSKTSVKKTTLSLSTILFLLFILAFVFAYQQKKPLTQRDTAIVIQPVVTVKSSPQENSTQLFLLHEGIKVDVIDAELQNWRKIQISDGNQGWIPTDAIEKI